MSETPQLSVLVPWYQRDELRLTLAANAPFFRAQQAEVLVLNCGGESEHLRDVIAASEVCGVRQLDISAPRFNKSLALNVGLSHCRSDAVFTLDADVILMDAAFRETKVSIDDDAFVTIEWVYESEPAAPARAQQRDAADNFTVALTSSAVIEFAFRDGARVQHQLSRRDVFGNRRASPGLLLAKKRDLIEIQGYNSKLETWGWEDDDVLVRLQYALGRRRVQRGSALHLSHGDDRRILHGSRAQSDQVNFLKCCRNYNSGLFLGTHSADIAWAADKVAETIPKVSPEHLAIAPRSQNHSLTITPDLEYCGNDTIARLEGPPDRSQPPVSLSELLLEAKLRKSRLQDCNILYVGIRRSALAARLSSHCRHITGVTLDETERTIAASLGLQNYQAVVCNKCSETFPTQLPLPAYDIIVDSDLASHVCCQRHLITLLENYSILLAPSGSIVTTQPGIGRPATGNAWSEADLAYLAARFELGITKAGYDLYALTSRKRSLPMQESE